MSEITEISGHKWATTTCCRRSGRLCGRCGKSDGWPAGLGSLANWLCVSGDCPEPSEVLEAQAPDDIPAHKTPVRGVRVHVTNHGISSPASVL